MSTSELVTRFLGNCQLCEGDFKLTAENCMVHHGFKRPGDGVIHGDCPGVGSDPYEVSCELIKDALTVTERAIANMKETLAQYKAGEITHFTRTVFKRGFGGRVADITHLHYSIGVTEPYTWKREFDSSVHQ